MMMHFKTESPWPARVAYTAAALLFFASAGTNLIYGWGKGSDIASSSVWAAVSLGASLIFSLCFPSLIQCCERKHWARACVVVLAMTLAGAYSVAAALGAAMGGRTNAAVEEKTVTDARSKAQAAYDLANSELQKLTDVRPAAELKALIEAAQREQSGLPNTRSVAQLQALINGARVQTSDCAAAPSVNRPTCLRLGQWKAEIERARQREKVEHELTGLAAEFARAEQRTKLKAEVEAAAEKLERIAPPKLANSDAVALSAFIGGLGLPVNPEKMNKWLVLLAVLVLEFGSGLALSVGMGWSASPAAATPSITSEGTACAAQPDPEPEIAAPVPQASVAPAVAEVSGAARFLEMLRAQGGHVQEGQRALGRKLGLSKTQVNRLIGDMAGANLITAAPGPKGTDIRLKSRPAI